MAGSRSRSPAADKAPPVNKAPGARVAGGRSAAADHEHARVEDRGQLGHAPSQPSTYLVKALQRRDVSVLGRLRDHRPRDALGISAGAPQELPAEGRRGDRLLIGLLDEGPPAGVLL